MLGLDCFSDFSMLKEIFKIMDCKETYRILSSFGFKNLDKLVFTFKIIFISMFFGLDIPFILSELESKEKLRKYFNISKFGVQIKFIKLYHFKTQKN